MARKTYRADVEDPTQPDWPTMRRGRLRNGMDLGIDNSAWLYMKVPMSSMPDATTEQDKLDAAQPIINAIEALGDMARIGPIAQRRMNQGEYREIHALSLSIPRTYAPSRAKQLAGFLSYSFPNRQSDERLMLFGTRLRPSGLSEQGGVVGATKLIVNATAEALAGRGAAPEEFNDDLIRVKRALTQAGLMEASTEEIRLADSWWSLGHLPDTPFLPHDDHLHTFMTNTAMNTARRLVEENLDCGEWPKIRGHHTLSIASVAEFDFDYLEGTSARAQWAISLFDQQSLAISARAKVEPVKVTRTELRRNRRRFQDDLNERYTAGKMSRAEEEETAGKLASMEEGYATGGMSTLVDTSILAAFSGKNSHGTYDASDSYGIATMATMGGRQPGGLMEMMLCSGVRANPNRHDVPAQMLACAGMQSLSQVGDEDGAVLGFTERDSQEVRLSPTAASSKDGLPMMAVLGATGSGKTMVLLWIASQFAQMRDPRTGRRRPNIIIDLKQESDHSPVVLATGGRVISLDDLTSADGVFDPLRFAVDPESGVEMAANMLLNINPWGPMRSAFETPIHKALMVGVAHGATCIGEALRLAQEHDPTTSDEMVEATFRLAESNHHFRACFGIDGQATEGLRVADGMTLIKLGRSALTLPGAKDVNTNVAQRVSAELVKMMVFGSAISLTGRGGVLHLDEAWMFLLGEAKANVEQLGRLARSQGVLPILYTQRCTDLVKAELKGYISRGLILHLKDEEEARAACELFGLEDTPERVGRIRASRTIGQGAVPNFLSMQSLRDPQTAASIRGSIGIHIDLYDRAAYTEIVLPKTFLDLASTNPDDIARREEQRTAGTLESFDYDPGAIDPEEEWRMAPIGRYMADVDHSVFDHRSLLFGRARTYAPLVGVDEDAEVADPWEVLPEGLRPEDPEPEDEPVEQVGWHEQDTAPAPRSEPQIQEFTGPQDDWDSEPRLAEHDGWDDRPVAADDEDWGASPDSWSDLAPAR